MLCNYYKQTKPNNNKQTKTVPTCLEMSVVFFGRNPWWIKNLILSDLVTSKLWTGEFWYTWALLMPLETVFCKYCKLLAFLAFSRSISLLVCFGFPSVLFWITFQIYTSDIVSYLFCRWQLFNSGENCLLWNSAAQLLVVSNRDVIGIDTYCFL